MSDKIKVLLLDTNDAFGGVVRGHLLFLRHADRTRFDLYAAVLGHGALLSRFLEIPDVTFWQIEVGTKSVKWCCGWRAKVADAWGVVPLVWSALRLAALCRRAGIQVLHTSDKKRSLLLTLLLHRLTGIPYVYRIHAQYVEYPANRRALQRAALITAISRAVRADFIAHLGPAMERIRLMYNSVDAEHFAPAADDSLRRELGAAPDEVLIGITGRLAPAKGQETFLQAAALVVAQEPRTRFVIVGDDAIFSDNADYVPLLRRQADAPPLTGRVAFLGFRKVMVNVYRGLDIIVNASWHEAFGRVVVEGMACAKPVVGAAVDGIPEIITHDKDGFLFPVRDAPKLAEILLELVRSPELRQRIGNAARQTVMDRFTIQQQILEQEALYEELAGKKS